MIRRIPRYPNVSRSILDDLETIKPHTGVKWDLKTPPVSTFKKAIKPELQSLQQECCAYCGLPLEITSESQIEHIAPKGGAKRPKHGEFTFLPQNLVLACSFCNGFTKKGNHETISIKDPVYENCTFKIVHPYFDNPDDHYEWTENEFYYFIGGKSNKGKKSIKMFKLDSLKQAEARSMFMDRERKKRANPEAYQKAKTAAEYKP